MTERDPRPSRKEREKQGGNEERRRGGEEEERTKFSDSSISLLSFPPCDLSPSRSVISYRRLRR
jgi:hypothetical protein